MAIKLKSISHLCIFFILLTSCHEKKDAKYQNSKSIEYELIKYKNGKEFNTYVDGKLKKTVFYNQKGIMTLGESYWKNTNKVCHRVTLDSLGRPNGFGDWNYYDQVQDRLFIKNCLYPCDFNVYEVSSYQNHDQVIDTIDVYKKMGKSYINLNDVYSKRLKKFHYLKICYEVPVRHKVFYCFSDLVRVGKSIQVDKYNLNGLW